jgi:hypothetical protein
VTAEQREGRVVCMCGAVGLYGEAEQPDAVSHLPIINTSPLKGGRRSYRDTNPTNAEHCKALLNSPECERLTSISHYGIRMTGAAIGARLNNKVTRHG